MLDAGSTGRDPLRVALIGGSFSGNKGAASMLHAVLGGLPQLVGACEFTVLSVYAEADRAEPGAESTEVVSWTPVAMVLSFVLACVAAVIRLAGLSPAALYRTSALRVLAGADVVADVGGISFVDGRGPVILAYNVVMPSVPLLLGRPVVKCSQAMGPFTEPANRLAARAVLPRLHRIFGRGERTLAHLRTLGLENLTPAADLAFVMPHEVAGTDVTKWPAGRIRLAVVPSTVVAERCASVGIDYAALLADFVDAVVGAHDTAVLVVPHSARPGRPASRTNDLPLCHDVASRVAHQDRVEVVGERLSPQQLRSVLAGASVVVTARFHAMISSLATLTPVVVTGWSHKYGEVLRDFGMEEFQVPFDELSVEALVARFVVATRDADEIRARIGEHLPQVQDSARRSLRGVADAALRR